MPEERRSIQQIPASETADGIEAGFAKLSRQKQYEACVTVPVKVLPFIRVFDDNAQEAHSHWTSGFVRLQDYGAARLLPTGFLPTHDLLRAFGRYEPASTNRDWLVEHCSTSTAWRRWFE